jgi:Hint domain
MFGLLNMHQRERATRFRPDEGSGQSGHDDGGAYRLKGFTCGTRVATASGWRPVEAIGVGDLVMTFDNDLQAVVAVTRGTHFAAAGDLPAFAVPIHVPMGAIGNDEPMVLLPEQITMIESDAAEALTGDPFALVPAKALEGFRGIDRIRGLRPVESVSLHFENDEVIFADGGALMLAPSAVPGIVTLDVLETAGGLPAPYTVHRGPGARALVEAMATEDARAFASSTAMRAA